MYDISPSRFRELFDEATQRLLDSSWMTFNRAQYWQDALPYPDPLTLSPATNGKPSMVTHIMGKLHPAEQERQLLWANWAMQFFHRHRERVRENLRSMTYRLNDELAAWNSNHPEKNEQLPFDETYREWLAGVEYLPLKEFSKLNITPDTAYQFLRPKFNKLIEKYGMLEERKRRAKQQLQPATVFIVSSARASLIHKLAEFVDEVDHNNLADLINGEKVSTFITANCTQNTLGKIFHEAYKDKSVQASKAILAKWLCQHFKRRTNGELYPLTESTMLRHLNGLGYNVN